MKVKKNNVSHPYYLCGECWREYCDSKRETELKHIPVGETVYELSSSNPDSKWTGARFCEKHYVEFIQECADIAGFKIVKKDDGKPFVRYACDKDKELKFLEALYLIQKASDLGNISLDKEPDKEAGVKGIIKDEIS